MTSRPLAESTILITGAGRGLGLACARFFARLGARVLLGARNPEKADAAAAAICGEGGRAVALEMDVGSRDSVFRASESLLARYGPPAALINNAGVVQPVLPLLRTDPGEWDTSIRINLNGCYYTMRALLPAMVAAGRGTVVNITSGAAVRPVNGWSAYCTAKAGVDHLTRVVALEVAASGVRVNALSPGLMDTGMQADIRRVPEADFGPQNSAVFKQYHREGKLKPPTDVARAVCWLAGPWSAPANGTLLHADAPEARARIDADLADF